jgi:hypothetical protein
VKPAASPRAEVAPAPSTSVSAQPKAPVAAAVEAVAKVADAEGAAPAAPSKLLATTAIPTAQPAADRNVQESGSSASVKGRAQQPTHESQKATAMNAIPTNQPANRATTVLNGMVELFSKNLRALSDATLAGTKAATEAQAQLLATSRKTLEAQVSHVTALSQTRNFQEAFELQQKFAREALQTANENAKALTTTLNAGFKATVEPLTARYNEATKNLNVK